MGNPSLRKYKCKDCNEELDGFGCEWHSLRGHDVEEVKK